MKKTYKIIAVLLLSVLLMVGCSSEDPEKPSDSIVTTNQVEDQDKTEDKNDSDKGNPNIKSKVLQNMLKAKEYTMETRQIVKMGEMEFESLLTSVVSGNQSYLKTEGMGAVLEIVEKDDSTYLIIHDNKKIIKSDRYEDDDEESELDDGEFLFEEMKFVTSGKEDFLGENRSYEEYDIDLGTIKYYFDGKKLAGMEMTLNKEALFDDEDYDDEEDFDLKDPVMKIEVLSYEEKADNSLFDLPKDYEIVGD